MTSYYIEHAGQQYKVYRSMQGAMRIVKSDAYRTYGGDIHDPAVREAAEAEYARSLREAVPLL